MNHAVLYVRDAGRHQRFDADVLGFETMIEGADIVADQQRFAGLVKDG